MRHYVYDKVQNFILIITYVCISNALVSPWLLMSKEKLVGGIDAYI